MSRIKVQVRHYSDRGDPPPPENWRVEVMIGRIHLVPGPENEEGFFTTEIKARRTAEKIASALKVEVSEN